MRHAIERFAGRFFEIQGVDRAVAVGGQAFTALFPLLILYATIAPGRDSRDFAQGLINRFELTGSAARSVRQAFAPAGTVQSEVTLLGIVLVIITALSFTRALQRLYEQAHQLPKLGMRGTPYGLAWLGVVVVAVTVRSIVIGDDTPLEAPGYSLVYAFFVALVSPYLLLGRRVDWRGLVPTGVLTAIGTAAVGIGSVAYMPRSVASSADQFGVIGVAFSLLTWLVAIGFVLVVAAVGGALMASWSERVLRRLRRPVHLGG
jgi:membrane protein